MMKKLLITLVLLPMLMLGQAVIAADHDHDIPVKRTPSPEGAKVYIVMPKDGKVVKQKFKVVFGLKGMGVSPAGITAADGIPIPNTGHHHLLIDVDKLPPLNVPLPADQPDHIKHFGGGQTEVMLELPPGKHTLQLILGDYAHVPHSPPVISQRITVEVK